MYIESSPNADGYVPNSSLFGPWIDSPTQVKYFQLVKNLIVICEKENIKNRKKKSLKWIKYKNKI